MSGKSVISKILFLIIISLLFAACENSTENNPAPDNTKTFPNKVGDKWIYAVHDSVTNSEDTLTISIVGTTTGNGKNLTVWTRKSNFYNDTFYVFIDKNTVYYYTDSYPNVIDNEIVFPLEVGKYWKNPDQISDSSKVIAKETVNVPADNFPDAYRIERNWSSFNVYGHSLTWFVDNVGIVKEYVRIQGFDNIKQTWELLDYTLQ